MNYHKKTIDDIDVSGKKVLLRCDFNVPQDKETGAITSDKRIVASLPTIRALLSRGAAVIACSHLGKPKGQRKESLSLRRRPSERAARTGGHFRQGRYRRRREGQGRRAAARPDPAAGESPL